MNIAFVKPNYPFERRVALLPSDVPQTNNTAYKHIFIETGFGYELGIEDSEYSKAGCTIASREECFRTETLFSLKLIQSVDYQLLREGGRIIGWMHPKGSGHAFYTGIAKEKKIDIFDIDSVYPRIYKADGRVIDAVNLPPHFFWKNSYIAGMAATKHGLEYFNSKFNKNSQICILGSGSVSQGAFQYLSSLGLFPRMFYRKTLNIFYESIQQYDLIVNGIEIDVDDMHILSAQDILKTKTSVLIIDAAADAGRSIWGTEYHSIDKPSGTVLNRHYTLINNAPTLIHKDASENISSVVAKYVLPYSFG